MFTIGAAAFGPDSITVFLLSLAALLGLARVLGEVARAYGQPVVLGEILAGVLLGPTVLGGINADLFAWLFPGSGSAAVALDGFVLLAATLLLLVVGLEVDLSVVWRQGRAALFVSAAGIALPFAAGSALAWLIPEVLGIGTRAERLPFSLFMGIAMSITALPVIAKIMMDLNLAKSDMGMLILSSAMLNDLVGWIGFACVLAMMPVADPVVAEAARAVAEAAAQPDVATTIIATLVFGVLMVTAGRWLCHRLLPYVQAHWTWPGGVLAFVSVVALVCAAFTEYLGIHSIFGAFIAGVTIGDSAHLRERTRDTIYQFVTNIFAPVFFASIGLRVNFIASFDLMLVAIVFVVALVGKVGGSYLGARGAGMGPRESWATGFGMAAQGVVGIILGQLAREADLISDKLLVAIIIMALGTSLMSGPAMMKILRSKQRRRLVDLLTDRHIIAAPKAKTIEQAIREHAERAAEITGLDAENIHVAVLHRERIMHTGLPHGLAVPHARIRDLAKPCIVISRHRYGVDFDSLDGERARIVCLLLTPQNQPDSQVELLRLFARTFAHPTTRRQALDAANATEFLAVLNLADSE